MLQANLKRTTCARIPTPFGQFQLCHYVDERSNKEHLALVHGTITDVRGVMTRVHSECFTGDVLGSLRCDCGEQLQAAMAHIAAEGAGLIIYLRQEGRGIGLADKLRAYNLQDQGYDTVDANLMLGHQADEREYTAAAEILADLGVPSIRLLTNNPDKIESLQGLGITIEERIPIQPSIHGENAHYLATKVERMRHLLALPATGALYSQNGAHAPDDAQPAPNAQPDLGLNAGLVQALAVWDEYMAEHSAAIGDRPFVTLTYAQTLDGTIANADGTPLHISGETSMRLTHALRTRHDAILVGIGTVLSDNPRLTARLVQGDQPQPVILDTHLRIPTGASVLQHPKGAWVATHLNGRAGSVEDIYAQQTPNARLLDIPIAASGELDLAALLEKLADLGIQRLMVEGGSTVIRNFLAAHLVDQVIVTIAPKFTGGRNVLASLSMADVGSQTSTLPTLAPVENYRAGEDTIIWGIPRWSSGSSPTVSLPTPERAGVQTGSPLEEPEHGTALNPPHDT